uniref:peptide-methionine (R)-S-oxide reductase n=1 Tax=Nothobranchius furzeri TaxID=105023 RepID=A0A8C6VS49_NOTFU
MKKHNINIPTKPYTTVRNSLVHPKDKIPAGLKCGVVYEIPCKLCNKTCIGETGRQLNTRTIEHRKEYEKETSRRHTRAAKQETVHKDSVIKHPEAWGPLKVCCRKCGNELGHEFLGDGPRDGQSCF